MVSQPVDTGGQVLGARKIVIISVTLDATGKSIYIPCYILDLRKPLWQGTVRNCGLVLGYNCIWNAGVALKW